MSDNQPIHLGTLEKTGTAETDDGPVLVLETDQGEFLVEADEKMVLDSLSMSVDMYLKDVVRGESSDQ